MSRIAANKFWFAEGEDGNVSDLRGRFWRWWGFPSALTADNALAPCNSLVHNRSGPIGVIIDSRLSRKRIAARWSLPPYLYILRPPRAVRQRMLADSAYDALSHTLAGRYRLGREIGRGGMSTVYAAHDAKHDRDVAIKVLLPELSMSVGAERFNREIRVLARLQHPHILPLFDSGNANGLLYFIMPYVEGESLRALLERKGSLSLDEATRIVRQLADALDYAHARSVVHRDVKPENVLLSASQVLLADFGIARASIKTEPGSGTALTLGGVAIGTPAYMSPEQAFGGEADARSDVYSLACVCYEMVTGRPPFSAPTAMALIKQHVIMEPPQISSASETVSGAYQAAVARALAKEQEGRFQTAGEFASALERAIAESRTPSPDDIRLRTVECRNASKPRVLVLDFANIAGAADLEWLSTGIVETVTADLGKIAAIGVVAQDAGTRRRVEAARKDRVMDPDLAAEIGRSLGARWAVWGAFQKFGSRIRITPHFMNVDTGAVAGGEKIDGDMEEIFSLQDRIVTGIADTLRIELTTAEKDLIGRAETLNVRAYEQYARGYREFLKFEKESIKGAAEHFRAAIAIDPDYAAAYAALGMLQGPMYIATGRREVLDEATRLLERALELDPTTSDPYAWLVYAQSRQGRFDDATQTALKGIERDPRSEMLWYMLGCSFVGRGVGDASPETFRRAVRPLLRSLACAPSYLPAYMVLASVYAVRGQVSHAVKLIDQAIPLEMDPRSGLAFIGSLVQRGILHLSEGDLDTGGALLDDAIRRYTSSDHVYAENLSAFAYVARAWLDERKGAYNEAIGDFERACAIADIHPHRIGIGAHWVKARFGIARCLHRLGREADAARALAEGIELNTSHDRFIWTWFLGGLDAEILYELASTHAAMGRMDEAVEMLRRAADAGWADVAWLRGDPSFEAVRDTSDIQRVCAEAASRVQLPPPVGEGGLP